MAFSPDGDLLFVGQYDGRGQLLLDADVEAGRPAAGRAHRADHLRRVLPDGRRSSPPPPTGRSVLWDVATQKPIGSPLVLAPNTFASAALSPDGSRLFAISTRGAGISFDISPEAWKRHACLVAGRG